jgi:hypothetical protein
MKGAKPASSAASFAQVWGATEAYRHDPQSGARLVTFGNDAQVRERLVSADDAKRRLDERNGGRLGLYR